MPKVIVWPLYLMSLALTFLGLVACTPRSAHQGCGDFTTSVPVHDVNKDPLFRAGTLPIWNDKYQGYGFLFEEQGQLKLGTIQHVATLTQQSCTYVALPGTGLVGALQETGFKPLGGSDDRLGVYRLSGNFGQALKNLVNQGMVQPLKLSTREPVAGEQIYIPQATTGTFTVYTVTGKNLDQWASDTDGSHGVICPGRSGGPILAVKDGHATTEVLGAVSRTDIDARFVVKGKTPQDPDCSKRLIFTPVRS